MNITNEALLKEMTAEERLDIFIQDDSAVYSVKLELFYALLRRLANAATR
ncbi:MAG: hypothetical protein IPL60_15785 [Ardenticatenia bacterium]|nr:hypothetical protein [Ardenticatenia bacterium]